MPSSPLRTGVVGRRSLLLGKEKDHSLGVLRVELLSSTAGSRKDVPGSLLGPVSGSRTFSIPLGLCFHWTRPGPPGSGSEVSLRLLLEETATSGQCLPLFTLCWQPALSAPSPSPSLFVQVCPQEQPRRNRFWPSLHPPALPSSCPGTLRRVSWEGRGVRICRILPEHSICLGHSTL